MSCSPEFAGRGWGQFRFFSLTLGEAFGTHSADPGFLNLPKLCSHRPGVVERLAAIGKPMWVRFKLVPGFTGDPANIDGIARFVAPMKNAEWVDAQPSNSVRSQDD